MSMHVIQEKILKLMDVKDISGFALREIAKEIGETGGPQKIKHHLSQLAKKSMIKVDKQENRIYKVKAGVDKGSNFVSLPIVGNANCGEAVCFADNHVEGYFQVSKNILGDLSKRAKNLFVLRAVGSSMNQSDVFGSSVEDGDYVIVDGAKRLGKNNSYVVSLIDGVANIKKIHMNKEEKQIVLFSESNQNIPPIYIHEDDVDNYLIAGTVVKVMKKPNELADFQNAAASDTLEALGPMSKKEHDYYMNI